MEEPRSSPDIPRKLRSAVRRRSSNLIPALLLLEGDRRSDALLFGDWCRHVDDIADNRSLAPDVKHAALESWLRALAAEHEGSLPEDFLEMIRRRNLDRELLREIIRGMLRDCGLVRFARFADLEPYCRRVASAVGLVSTRIFGAQGAVAERYAEQLGIALQLTNILRDVAEDAAMDRIYIPLEDLERFGVSEAEILSGSTSPAMTHLLHYQAERVDSWFAKAEIAWSKLTVNQKRLMRPARLMSAIYRELLLAIHRDRYDVFAKRYRVSGPKKLALLLQLMTSGN
ncbi:MAG: squalene synthase HpnD [Proteobacteria bacterium]|jgi:phytoene synthase|nr:squalene synthase HpnD [Pseudomonadota bacterium]